jgi:hypothetical protein
MLLHDHDLAGLRGDLCMRVAATLSQVLASDCRAPGP